MKNKYFISIMFIVMGNGSTFVGYKQYKKQNAFLSNALESKGIIIGVQKEDKDSYIPTIEFIDEKGTKVKFNDRTYSGGDIILGDSVNVLYSPIDSTNAQTKSHRMMMAYAFIGVGLFFILMGCLKLLIFDRKKISKPNI